MTLIVFSYSTADQNRCIRCVQKIQKNTIEIAINQYRTDFLPCVDYYHEECFIFCETFHIVHPQISGIQSLSESDQVKILEKLQGLFIYMPMELV